MIPIGFISVNVLFPKALVASLDAYVASERAATLSGRVSRSSIVRDALIAHLADATSKPAGATVAPAFGNIASRADR